MASIEEYYEKYWENPEAYGDPTTPQRQALLDKVLPQLPANAKILDVGCGRGEFCEFFVKRGFRAEGTDLSKAVIAFAQRKVPAATFRACLVEDMLPEHKESFDAVFSSEVIEHLFDVGTYLLSINHLLKPNGLVILTTPYHGIVKNIVISLLNYHTHYHPLGQHIRFFDTKSLNECLELFGFRAEHWWGYGRPWPMWKSFFVVARKVAHAEPLKFGTQGSLGD